MDAAAWIRHLGLEANPEGGHYRLHHAAPSPDPADPRPLITVIYYLLDAASPPARLHAGAGASLHFHHLGGALRIHSLDAAGEYRAQRLGPPCDLQVAVPGGAWKAIEVIEGPWALISEAVVPGWTAADHRSAGPELRGQLAPGLWERLAPFVGDPAGAPSATASTTTSTTTSADAPLVDPRAALDLAPHLEGGAYRQTWSAAARVATASGERPAANSIYYLLDRASPIGHLHRNTSAITHFFHAGGPIRFSLLDPGGAWHEVTLGADPGAGERLAFTCPGGWWKASQLAPAAEYGLISEIVAPGFDEADRELADADLVRRFPGQRARITGLIAPERR